MSSNSLIIFRVLKKILSIKNCEGVSPTTKILNVQIEARKASLTHNSIYLKSVQFFLFVSFFLFQLFIINCTLCLYPKTER